MASKIFARCIFTQIQIPIKTVLNQNQAGFGIGCSCADITFVIRRLIEESAEFQKPLFINFINFEKAFDSVFRTALWEIMREYGRARQKFFHVLDHVVQYKSFLLELSNSSLDQLF
jgi:hypothetical protein